MPGRARRGSGAALRPGCGTPRGVFASPAPHEEFNVLLGDGHRDENDEFRALFPGSAPAGEPRGGRGLCRFASRCDAGAAPQQPLPYEGGSEAPFPPQPAAPRRWEPPGPRRELLGSPSAGSRRRGNDRALRSRVRDGRLLSPGVRTRAPEPACGRGALCQRLPRGPGPLPAAAPGSAPRRRQPGAGRDGYGLKLNKFAGKRSFPRSGQRLGFAHRRAASSLQPLRAGVPAAAC
ncbi:transcription initiation factor TFIID subunit 4-like [Anser cygnoides]|uniref:transcription initiation factor TFIID subunit 4-like n=1 Tax=Anser cygnoides TaxID=8845 RepID=UPI0034D33841